MSFISSLAGGAGAPAQSAPTSRITQLPDSPPTDATQTPPTGQAASDIAQGGTEEGGVELVLGVEEVEQILQAVASGSITVDQVMSNIRSAEADPNQEITVDSILQGGNSELGGGDQGQDGGASVPPGIQGQDSEWTNSADSFFNSTFQFGGRQ